LTTIDVLPIDVFVVVSVKIIVVVDVDVAVVPIAITPVAAPSPPGSSTKRYSGAPHQSCPRHIAGIGVVVIRSFSRSSSVNDRWVVRWNVNDVGTGLLYLDHLLAAAGHCLGLHNLLRAGF
jgi:hypothetical protein